MKITKNLFYGTVVAVLWVCLCVAGCTKAQPPQALSGAKIASAEGVVKTDAAGHTVEQANIIDRMKADNTPGAMKHLYVISTYSGQCILYSPVRGKVTSSGKRLSPEKLGTAYDNNAPVPTVTVGGYRYNSNELPDDSGTYGSSIEYLYWFTPDGRYHQHYLGGGQIVHISDEPVAVKNVLITITTGPEKK
jgi:hypothetical protein